jgi:hypothetical protein
VFELIFFLGLLCVGALCLVGIIKLLVMVVILPLKIAFWMTKGIAWLLFGIPLIVISFLVIAGVFPIVIALLLIPVLLCAVLVGAVASLVF